VTKQQNKPLPFKIDAIFDPSCPDLQSKSAGVEALSYWNGMALELSASNNACVRNPYNMSRYTTSHRVSGKKKMPENFLSEQSTICTELGTFP
jgi:hypothetical protein